jgi:hypothetical protein
MRRFLLIGGLLGLSGPAHAFLYNYMCFRAAPKVQAWQVASDESDCESRLVQYTGAGCTAEIEHCLDRPEGWLCIVHSDDCDSMGIMALEKRPAQCDPPQYSGMTKSEHGGTFCLKNPAAPKAASASLPAAGAPTATPQARFSRSARPFAALAIPLAVGLLMGLFAAFRFPAKPNPNPAPPPTTQSQTTSDLALIGRRYEIARRIGEGGMGLVFAGRDLDLNRFVAIKKMRPELKLNQRDKDRFLREAKLSSALHHPAIVDIYDIVQEAGETYLVFEYVDGETMDRRLDRGPMTAEELMPPLKFVCQALAFAHANKVVHRDLKPSNIMLTRQGAAKVMDFGIAREIKDTASKLTNMDTSGTLAYMAPEQELGKYDGRSDLFSLAVTLYEALTGALPFPGPNFLLQKERMVFKPLSEAAPQSPRQLSDAIERCLRYKPVERFQTAAEFAEQAGLISRG